VLAECAITERPLTIADLPDLLPAVLEPGYDQLLPAWLGGEAVVLPEQMPRGLPATAARQLAEALAPRRPARRTGPGVPGTGSQPARAGDPVVIDEVGVARLLGFLAQVVDRRALRGRRYPLPYLLALPVVAMPAGHLDLTAVAEWVTDAPDTLLLILGAPTGRDGRPRRPDAKTLTEALALHGEDYDRVLCALAAAVARARHRDTRGGPLRRCLHVDGKAQHGAARPGGRTPMLLAACTDEGTIAAQQHIPVDKTNEIRVFQPLIDQLDDTAVAGVVFTTDQLHTQRGHARYIHGRDGFYVFTVGGNQPNLFAALDALPWHLIAVEHATIDRGHGRIEVRTIRTLPASEAITGLFPHAEQVFLLERYIYTLDGKPLGAVAVLGITNLTPAQADPADLLAYVRGHWSVESLHWLRDVVLGEDDSRMSTAARAMTALRNLVIGLFRLAGITRISRHLRRNGRDPYRRPLVLLGLAKPERDQPDIET
jgi:predicted transposase YbfD/YdcC